VTVARPSRILGPGDRENLAFFKIVARGIRLIIGGPERPISMIDVRDAARFLLALAQRDEAVGQAFFAAHPEPTTFDRLQQGIADELGRTLRTLYLPQPALLGLSAAADVISKVTGKHLPLNKKLARQLLAPAWTCSTRKAQERLGWAAQVSLESSIRESARWYRERGWM
jgi:nucleoside-diphosphate-sugar epimerase